MTYVMSDIHGNKERFDSVMNQIKLKPEDTLYILGDVIDRYPDGIRILRQLMKMPNVRMLLGNHEVMMLNVIDADRNRHFRWPEDNLILWYRNGGDVTHNYLKHIRKELRTEVCDYLKSLPLNYIIEVNGQKFVLAHGAPTEKYPIYSYQFDDLEEYAVWKRWKPNSPDLDDSATLIFGHTPTSNYQFTDPLTIWHSENNKKIGIDCGCGFPVVKKPYRHFGENGRLACLRLDDMKEFYSES